MGEFEGQHLAELRRGTVVLACLLVLRVPGYGYGLLEHLQRSGFEIDANTLYPLLRRLEQQGYLTSEWDTEGARPRKFYRSNAAGSELAATLSAAWDALNAAISAITPDVDLPSPRS